MTCRHAPGDPNCSSSPEGQARERAYAKEVAQRELARSQKELQKQIDALRAQTPDAENYQIEEVHRAGPHLVLKVRYPSCAACAYEGVKVMVFLDVPEGAALRWRRIDPHFRAWPEKMGQKVHEAPPPAARFPASEEGWRDALEYAHSKNAGGSRTRSGG